MTELSFNGKCVRTRSRLLSENVAFRDMNDPLTRFSIGLIINFTWQSWSVSLFDWFNDVQRLKVSDEFKFNPWKVQLFEHRSDWTHGITNNMVKKNVDVIEEDREYIFKISWKYLREKEIDAFL